MKPFFLFLKYLTSDPPVGDRNSTFMPLSALAVGPRQARQGASKRRHASRLWTKETASLRRELAAERAQKEKDVSFLKQRIVAEKTTYRECAKRKENLIISLKATISSQASKYQKVHVRTRRGIKEQGDINFAEEDIYLGTPLRWAKKGMGRHPICSGWSPSDRIRMWYLC